MLVGYLRVFTIIIMEDSERRAHRKRIPANIVGIKIKI